MLAPSLAGLTKSSACPNVGRACITGVCTLYALSQGGQGLHGRELGL